LGLVFRERHFLDAPTELAGFSSFQRVFALLFVFEVELHERCADAGVFAERGREGDARQLPL
jgi:hypothetical protein